MTTMLLGVSASATTFVWDLGNTTGGPLGSSAYATGSTPSSSILLTDRGFNANGTAHLWYWNNAGADEHGIGFVNTSVNELTLVTNGSAPANFLRIDVSPIYLTFTLTMIRIQSPTDDENWDLYGTNTLGQLSGATLLINGGTAGNAWVAVPDWDSFKYYDITVHPDWNSACDNVPPETSAAVGNLPEPATFGLFATGAGALLLMRKRIRVRN